MVCAEKVRHWGKSMLFNRVFTSLLLLMTCCIAYAQQPSYTINTCTGNPVAFTFSGALPGTTYTWTTPVYSSANISGGTDETTGQSSVRQTLSLVSGATAVETATYTVTPSQGSSFQLIVRVTPPPVLSSNTSQISVCSGTNFVYLPSSATAGTSITWSRQLVAGINNNGTTGNGNVNEILKNITTDPIDVKYIFTLNANGCRNDEEIVVTVKATPFLNSTLEPPAICSGEIFDYQPTSIFSNTTFNWQRTANASINGGLSQNGTGNPNEQLNNTSLFNTAAVYTYTMTDNATSCIGTQVISVAVKPVPNIGPQVITSCSENNFKLAPVSVPYGTKYTWGNPTLLSGSVTGMSAASVGQNYVHQELKNNGASTAQLVYTVRPVSFDCVGADFVLTANITTANSKATLTSALIPPTICSKTTFNYIATSNTATGYEWERFLSDGISNVRGTGNTNVINEVLENTVTGPSVAQYAVTLTANGCSHTQDVNVTVSPHTLLNTSLTPSAICSNNTFTYVPGSYTPSTAFNWTRGVVAGISNAAASGTDNPNEVLVNTTNAAIPVTYIYSLVTVNGCTNTQNVVVRVQPTPALNSSLTPPAICSGSRFNYTPVGTVTGSSFSWTRAFHAQISNGPGAGANDPNELLVNSTDAPVTVPYVYRTVANGCFLDQTLNLVVNPTPKVFSQAIEICSGQSTGLSPANVPSNTLYTWTNPVITPNTAIIGATAQATGVNKIDQTLSNRTTSGAMAVYTVAPIAGTCIGASFVLSVTTKPVPAISNQVLQPVCSGAMFVYTPTNVPAGTQLTWSLPVQTPFNTLTGANAQPINMPSLEQRMKNTTNQISTAVYSVTPSVDGCDGGMFTLTVPVNPVAIIDNILDTICTGNAFSIAPADVPANTNYRWTIPQSFPFGVIVGGSAQAVPVTTISQTLLNTTTLPAKATYSITPVSGNCAGDPFLVTIVVGNALPAFGNLTATVCSASVFDVTPNNAPADTKYTWAVPAVRPAGAIAGLTAQALPVPVVSQALKNLSTVTDTVVYSIRAHNTGCTSPAFTAAVRILPSPRALITGNAVVCRYPEDTLGLSFVGTGPWTFKYNDGATERIVSNVSRAPYSWIVPASAFGVSSRTLAITEVKDAACTSIDTAYFTQRINALPVGKIITLHGNYICNNTTDTLYVSAADSLGKKWTYNGRVTAGLTSDSITTVTPGSYNAILTNRFGCVDTAAAPVALYEVKRPKVKFVYDSYCINTQIRFSNQTDTTGMGRTDWSWNFGDSTDAITYNATHTYKTGGKHHVKLVAHQLYCPADYTTADSVLDIQYPIPAFRHPSVSAYKRQPTPLQGRELAGYKYQWIPTKGIDDPFDATPNFNLEVTQEYLINLISPAGCITKDSMLVRAFDENLVNIMIPKSFTPNWDGVNDILFPYLSGIKSFQYFRVYNRFGKLLFETRNPDQGWNGGFNGTPQPMGIYIWVSAGTALDGSLVERRGETLLIR